MIGPASADSMAWVFRHGSLILPDRVVDDGVVVCRGDRITAVGGAGEIPVPVAAVTIDAGGGYIAPGLVDIHSHGGGGADFMDGTPDAVVSALREHARRGTTTIFPTTTAGPARRSAAWLHACLAVRDSWAVGGGARIGGVHFYGPTSQTRWWGRTRRDAAGRRSRTSTCRSSISASSASPPARRSCPARWTTAAKGPGAGTGDVRALERDVGRDAGVLRRRAPARRSFWSAMSSVASLRQRFSILEHPMQAAWSSSG